MSTNRQTDELRKRLTGLFACETAILDPADAHKLAELMIEEVPEITRVTCPAVAFAALVTAAKATLVAFANLEVTNRITYPCERSMLQAALDLAEPKEETS